MAGHDPLLRLQQLIVVEREDIVTLIIYGVGVGLLSLATPIAVQALVNTIVFGTLLQPLFVLAMILFVLLACSNSLVSMQFYVAEMLQRRLFVRFFAEAAHRLEHTTQECRDNVYLPELANRFFDVVSLQKNASTLLLEAMGYFLQTVIGMVLLAFYHPMLLAFDIFLIAAMYFILFVMGKNGVPTMIEQSKLKYETAAWLEGISATPLLGRSRRDTEFFDNQTRRIADEYLGACERHFRILYRQNTSALAVHVVANTALLAMGGWMVIERQLSLGQLIAAELVVSAMVYGLTRVGKMLNSFYELVASIDKIGYFLDLPQERDHGRPPKKVSGPLRVDIHQLTMAGGLQTDEITDLDLQLAAGDSLVVSAGAGRGTLLDALYGLRAPAAGYIEFNGQDLRDLNLGALRDYVSLVRHAEVISASIVDNLTLGHDMEPDEIRAAFEHVGLLDEIVRLPDGMNTELGTHGVPLSYEQCLRLTLARAMAARPRLLMIDRVLDRIDQNWLPRILDCLFADGAGWTLVIISHNPEIIARSRRHAQISGGQLTFVEGNHEPRQ